MRLYMIRHGESEANATRSHAGWAQIPLTEKGREDAKRAVRALAGISFDKVYTSDLLRAIQTKELVLPGAPFEQTPLLREIDVGTLAGKTLSECEIALGEEYITRRAEKSFTAYGGEDHVDHRTRAAAFLKRLEAENYTRVAAFCHEGTMLRVLEIVSGAQEVLRRPCANGGVCIFEYQGGQWSLLEWDV